MRALCMLLCVCLLSLSVVKLFAQSNKSISNGIAMGKLKDTVNNRILRSATVSVYNISDSTLLSYQLANTFAAFEFKDLPIDRRLRLEVSFTGYDLLELEFLIPGSSGKIDLGSLNMKVRSIVLQEVQIKIPPISTNGDTLEINPGAFKADSNAAIEKVLRKTPGIELWGDGTITVNGREIKKVLVNGKAFFGGNPKIALQNLPNKAVETIQVYRESSEQNPTDSNMTMNVKLKKNRPIGLFGKVGGGYGSSDRYEIDGTLNFYNNKTQVALAGASNNVNKRANDINQLLENSTYSESDANTDYQPNFRLAGITKPSVAGLYVKHNFNSTVSPDNRNELDFNYFLEHNESENIRTLQNQTTIGPSELLLDNQAISNRVVSTGHKLNSKYELNTPRLSFSLSQQFEKVDDHSTNNSKAASFNQENQLISTNSLLNDSQINNEDLSIGAVIRRKGVNYTQSGFPPLDNLFAKYNFIIRNNYENTRNLSDFQSLIDTAENERINRTYDNISKLRSHDLLIETPKIDDIVREGGFRNFDIVLVNALKIDQERSLRNVYDLDSVLNSTVQNAYLSNNLQTNQLTFRPGLNIIKSYHKGLSNRFAKSAVISLSLSKNFITYESTSEVHSFQNIKRNYESFLPSFVVELTDNQYSSYRRSLKLDYHTEIQIPTIQQLAPLTDSTNVFFLYRGNQRLKEAYKHVLSISFANNNQSTKNTFNYKIDLTAMAVKNSIADSIQIDNENRRQISYANVNGQKSLTGQLQINKAFNVGQSKFQIRFGSNFTIGTFPTFINQQLNRARIASENHQLKFFYSYEDKLGIEFTSQYFRSVSKQMNFETEFQTKILSNILGINYNIFDRLTINTNVTVDHNSASIGENVNFTIWNAYIKYKLFKNKSTELKFSALDLLHQNSSVINYAGSNYITTGNQSVLRQYFMVSLSYYPRFFGKK